MKSPNETLESEDESEVSSKIASNKSIQEISPDPSNHSTTSSSCLTNPIQLQTDPGLTTLELTLGFNACDAEMKAMHEDNSSDLAAHMQSGTMPRVFSIAGTNFTARKLWEDIKMLTKERGQWQSWPCGWEC